MNGKRIVVVGGGSQFCVLLAESLVDYGHDLLAGSTIVLLDVRQDHLDLVHKYSTDLANVFGVDLKFEKTTDRRKAFEGADFVLTTFRPGTHDQQRQDETVPPQYGLQGNETVSIGGIFMACRVVPVLREMLADMEAVCPDAWIINYTNPTQHVGDATRRLSRVKIISLCDGYVEVPDDLAVLLGVDPSDVMVYTIGTNHATWIKRLTIKGEDGYPMLEKRLKELGWDEIEKMYAPPKEFQWIGIDVNYDTIYRQFVPHYRFPFSLKLFQTMGLLPQPRYYWRYYLDQDAIIEAQKTGEYVSMAGFYLDEAVHKMMAGLDNRFQGAVKRIKELRSSQRAGGASHGDLAVRVIASIANNLGETFVVNVPNQGAISNLPEDCVVEVAAQVDRTGAHPFAMGPIPKHLLGFQHALVLAQELAVDAALSGSRTDLLRAILAHPLIHSMEAAEKAMDELLGLQAEWLPQFRQG